MAATSVIDSSVLVAAERSAIDLDELIRSQGDDVLVLAAITASEILHGLHRAKRAHHVQRELFVERALGLFAVIPFDLTIARVHAGLWSGLAAKGVAVGPHDLIIAATAIGIGAAVITRDKRSFPKIPGLEVKRW